MDSSSSASSLSRFPGTRRALLAYGALAGAAVLIAGVSAGLWRLQPDSTAVAGAGATALTPSAGVGGGLVPLAAAEAPPTPAAVTVPSTPVPAASSSAARATPVSPEGASAAARGSAARGALARPGQVQWGAGEMDAVDAGDGSPGRGRRASTGEADLTTRPVPQPSAARLQTGSFFGLPAGYRTVYVIDASGSLIDTLASVQRELARSVQTLHPSQSYAVLFFQDGEVRAAPPGLMSPASREQTHRTASFVSPEAGRVLPAGRADAAAALEVALDMNPDAVILLSDHVEGRVDPEGTRQRLTAAARAVAGRTAIHTIQFVDAPRTPADGGLPTLERLSSITGGTHRFVGF